MRKKSFSLGLLILLVICVLLLVILSVYLINKTNKIKKITSDESSTQLADFEEDSSLSKKKDNSFMSTIEEVDNSNKNSSETSEDGNNSSNETNETRETNQTDETNNQQPPSEDKKLTLNSHTYKFNSSIQATIVQNSENKSELQINYPENNFKILYNSDSSINFENLKATKNLREHIESTYKVSITDSLKSGKLKNLDIIICTISDDNKPVYLLFTPLNNSEIAYAKIYNTENEQSLVGDLTNPLDAISSIISSIE